MDAMRLLPLFLVVPVISAITDPCNKCSLPVGFNETDGSLCEIPPIDDTYAPTFIRYPLGKECYLQMMDCPAYDVISDSRCAGIVPPRQALRCVNGTFRVPGQAVGQPIEKIRCNPYAMSRFPRIPNSFELCQTPFRNLTETCGETDSKSPGYLKTNNNTHVSMSAINCDVFNILAGYDGIGTCRQVETPILEALCENAQFKLPDGRFIYNIGCGVKTPVENNTDTGENNTASNCTAGGWKYNWMTDSYFKLGYNKSRADAKAACIADGGQLASIHSQEENDFILLMAYTENKEASIGEGIFVWIGAEVDDYKEGFMNLDGSPVDYSFWGAPNPSGDGYCIRITTGPRYGYPGCWNDIRCSADSHAYACRKSPKIEALTTCPGCEPITRGTPSRLIFNTTANASLWAIYENTPSGCTATIKCKSTLLGATVYLGTERASTLGEDFNEVTVSGRYNCINGKWRDINYPNFNGTNDYREIPSKLVCMQDDHVYHATACKRCHPIVPLSTSEQGFINGQISISYTTHEGCASSRITCSSTKPNYKVALYNGDTETVMAESCNTVVVENVYTCNNKSLWEPSLTVICKQSLVETCPGTACSSCPPITQATMLGMPSGTLYVSYDMSNGCTRANLKCTATAPGNRVTMFSNYAYVFGERCNEITFDAGYICQNTSTWVDAEGDPASSEAACVQNEDSGC